MDKVKSYLKKYWGILIAVVVCLGLLGVNHSTKKIEKANQKVDIVSSKGPTVSKKHVVIASASAKHIKTRKRAANHTLPGVLSD